MRALVVTPDATFYEGEASSVTLQASDGSMGILPGHAPLIAALGHGVAQISDGQKTHRVVVYGGFVKVQDDVVSVLAGGASMQRGTREEALKARDEAARALEQARAAGDEIQIPEAEERLRRAQAFLGLF